ncbi:MAG: hypothetical protein CVU71_11815 [Deltaproteobacteria bacterium HGW-Deltaproteobacteria-6]|nr:MAG: hypothetical protein CVU71_11815 [Deltaproteobacteria bacterium HGW-Deltaproteobacteria-6]
MSKSKAAGFRGPRLVSYFFERYLTGRPHGYDYYYEQSYTGLYLNSAAVKIFKKHNYFLINLIPF